MELPEALQEQVRQCRTQENWLFARAVRCDFDGARELMDFAERVK